jgi:hypothetical protein
MGANMLEALLVPVVKKAVDFLFDEGRDVLKAYHERNKLPTAAHDNATKAEEETSFLQLSKDDVLRQKIDESRVDQYRDELDHLLRLQEIHARNYHLAKEQEAMWKELAPAIIVNRIIISEKDLADTSGRLAVVLSKVYGDLSVK